MEKEGGKKKDEPPHFKLNSLAFEREVLERLGPLYGFDKDDKT